MHDERDKEKKQAEQMQPAALDPGMGGQLYLTGSCRTAPPNVAF